MKSEATANILTAAGYLAKAIKQHDSPDVRALYDQALDVYLDLVAEVNDADVGLTREGLAAMIERLADKAE